MRAGRDHGRLAGRIPDHEADRVGAKSNIEGDGDQRRTHGPEERLDELESVGHGEQNAIPGNQAAPCQRGGNPVHPRVQLSVGDFRRRIPREIDNRRPVGVFNRRGPVEIAEVGLPWIAHRV